MAGINRRSLLKGIGSATIFAASAPGPATFAQEEKPVERPLSPSQKQQAVTRERRLAWWRDARFGMFIHWGLYSVLGQHEWALDLEGIPIPQYEILAKHFKPKPSWARDLARTAKQAGQKYMVMTTKHHEGFCMWDTRLTDYNAAQQGPGRDLVHEFVVAARAEGLRIGFYYSLMDWHHPDGLKAKTDPEARRRFVEYTHGLLHELMSHYGKIDILWYDVNFPLNAEQWEADRMNAMVFQLQPEIIVNNRNGLMGDFSTPERKITPEKGGRAWESCMTLNDSWGYDQNDELWKSPREIVTNLAICSQGGGNLLLNIGPEGDGSLPAPAIKIFQEIGSWLKTNGEAIYATDPGDLVKTHNAYFTRRGKTLYLHQRFWPGHTPAAEWLEFFQPEVVIAFGGLNTKIKSAKLLKTREKILFRQDDSSVRLISLPLQAPDSPSVVIEMECEDIPVIEHSDLKHPHARYKVGISS